MAYILKRARPQEIYDARSQRYRIIKTARVKRCGLCTFLVPEADIVIERGVRGSESAIERCPMCKDQLTAEWLASEERTVAAVKAAAYRALFQPPQFSVKPLQEPIPSAVTRITDDTGDDISQSRPLTLTPQGDIVVPLPIGAVGPTALYLSGQRFTSSDVIVYPTGVFEYAAPIVTPTLITLSIYAFLGLALSGIYDLSFNSHVYHRCIRIA